VRPDVLLSSPLVRAYQTAEIVGAHLGLTPQVAEPLAPGCGASELLALLADHSRAGAVMTVGHEPDISTIIAELSGGRVEVKKGALARLDLTPGATRATLCWLVPPRGLR
jgi:phosphohistidine phosphatase